MKQLLIAGLVVAGSAFVYGQAKPGERFSQAATAGTFEKKMTLTRINVNGGFAEVSLVDGDTQGILTASTDAVAKTSSVDFSYAFLDRNDPNIAILIAGAGLIPNSSLTLSLAGAHLLVTTPFEVNRCAIDLTTGLGTCVPTTPSSFDMTWASNGFGSSIETTRRVDTLGPLTTKFNGTFMSRTATVNGTWDGHTTLAQAGDLEDTQSVTVFREITLVHN
jgi:hypothetical protein